MKRTTRAALSVLLVACFCGGVGYAQNLSAGKIKNPHVGYAPASELKKYPLPVVTIQRAGLGNDAEKAEILDRIVYPVINKSPRPIAALIVELIPLHPHPKTKADIGFREITVMVLWHDGGYAGTLIQKHTDGHFDEDAHAVLLASDDDCCSDEECETGLPGHTP